MHSLKTALVHLASVAFFASAPLASTAEGAVKTRKFGGESRIGLFVCSGNTFASSTATFENVAITPR